MFPREMEDGAVELLRALIRIDTSNPPGHERAATELIADRLRGDHVEPQILEGKPGRSNLIARLKANTPSPLPPLMLTAHLDVVPAEASRWKHPPFGAVIEDGWIWGRGAVDMKNMAAMSVAVMQALAREKRPLQRDLLLVAVADEETGCAWGSRWLVDNHKDLVRAEYALGELGGFTQPLGKARLYPIQVAQKGVVWVRASVEGTAGHGSMPREDNAVVRLSAALSKLTPSALPIHEAPAARAFIEALAHSQPGLARVLLPQLFRPAFSKAVLARIPDRGVARALNALLRNTASPTVLRAGGSTNVIPSRAEAEVDARILPGQNAEDLLRELREVMGADIHLEILQSLPPVQASAKTPLFATLQHALERMDPGGIAVPYLVPGFTDAGPFSLLGTTCYGFSPIRFPATPAVSFADLYHGHNERIPVNGFLEGLRALYNAVTEWCGA